MDFIHTGLERRLSVATDTVIKKRSMRRDHFDEI